jgi:O-antigen ligase
MVAMIFSAEFLLSQAMILLVALAVFQVWQPDGSVRFAWRAIPAWNNWKSYPPYWLVAMPFLIVLLTAFWSSDATYTLERLRIKLPFLLMPFAFAAMPRFSKREVYLLLFFLLGLMVVASLYVGANYLMDFDYINEQMGKGHPLPTPSNHIRFSIVLGCAILAGGTLFYEKFYLRHPRERWLIGGATLLLFAFIHVLSVRSGLLLLYVGMLTLAAIQIVRTRRWAWGIGALAVVVGLPLLSYQVLPTFRTKINYMRWDIQQHLAGKGANYSDSERLTSMSVGLQIGNEHPVVGVGAGDLKQEVRKVYAIQYPDLKAPKMPHNQFVTIYASAGILGLALFLLGFFFPLFYHRNYQTPLFLVFHVVIFCSCLIENTLENNYGVSLYLLFLLIGLNYLRAKSEKGRFRLKMRV